MTGVQYITDSKGKRVSVVIDLRTYGDLWEDFYDAWLAEQSAGDDLIPWETAKKMLRKPAAPKRAAKRQSQPVRRSKPVTK